MNSLESRKRLLLAESELNRAQLVEDMAALSGGVRALIDRVKTVGSIASTIAVLMAGLTAFRHPKPASAESKPSWLQTIFKGASLISTLWMAFRSQGCEHKRTVTK